MAPIEFATSLASPAQAQADLLVLPCYRGPGGELTGGPGVAEASHALGLDLLEQLRGPAAGHGFRGRAGDVFETLTLGRLPAPRLLIVGLGDGSEAGPAAIRRAAMMAASRIGAAGSVATTIPVPAISDNPISENSISDYPRSGDPAADGQAAASAFAEGLLLGAYQFRRYLRQPLAEAAAAPPILRQVTVLTTASDQSAVAAGLRHGEVIGQTTNWVRDLVTTPAADLAPADMVDVAQQLAAGAGLKFGVLDVSDLEEGGFGGILGVGQGSVRRPKLVELSYRGGDGPLIALTGKGITFDAGGLNLKRTSEIQWMKADLAGAATIMAVLRAAAELSLPVSIDAALPFAENMPGGAAIRPGDVISHRGGRTAEVVDTDCEGRLVVADALAYLAERSPAVLIDVATLTDAGGLGGGLFAAMGNDDGLAGAVLAAGAAAGDPGWQLPLPPAYRRYLESAVADIRNQPRGVPDSTVMAGLYLSAFPGDVPWLHIDNGSTAYLEQATDCWPEGATGSPARALVRWLEDGGAA